MINEAFHLERPLRWGMVGGGQGSQIGSIHRQAAGRDRRIQFDSAARDIAPKPGQAVGTAIGLDSNRCYPDYQAMLPLKRTGRTVSKWCPSPRRMLHISLFAKQPSNTTCM